MSRVLLVEDDERLAALLCEYLAANGLAVTHESDGGRATERILLDRPEVVILDLLLPGASGFEVCRRVRAAHGGGILMLTASRSEADQVAGLELGADDFVMKPVDPRVLLARVRSLLRRVGGTAARGRPSRLEEGSLVVDRERREVRVHGAPAELTEAEFGVLYRLVLRAGEVVSREELHVEVLGTRYDGLDRNIDAHVSRLRRKLAARGFEPSDIQAVRGTGYRLVRQDARPGERS